MGPAPPKGTGPHRYVLVLLRQPTTKPLDVHSSSNNRAKFDVSAFAKQHDLTPVSANWFIVKG
ncbi:hypothetical protein HK097_002888 [Rhizophlyctis rosea]|uniref:PEBP-like protein n=1 Tax=Rhizophlyctis rosea TaxID=64517 RepID=A0AAD5WY62_9FUNG|nr:hypothetical protein HK097_002888 [Rhizophlyctis rosea]